MRQEGYYWVKFECYWHIAFFRHRVLDTGFWSLSSHISTDDHLEDFHFEEINENRLVYGDNTNG